MASLRYSCLYTGWLRHRRFAPQTNTFKYDVFMLLIDLQEIEPVLNVSSWCSSSWLSVLRFKREDFHGPKELPIYDAIVATVKQATGQAPQGRIAVLANLRYCGFQMNPLTTYYCFNQEHTAVEYVVAEVHNTPWNERHAYVLPVQPGQTRLQCAFKKELYVSPFNPLDMEYHWLSTSPDEHLMIHIENWQQQKILDATLMLNRLPLTAANLRRLIIRFPLMTVKVAWLIYWQAFKLWLKKVPYHPHAHY